MLQLKISTRGQKKRQRSQPVAVGGGGGEMGLVLTKNEKAQKEILTLEKSRIQARVWCVDGWLVEQKQLHDTEKEQQRDQTAIAYRHSKVSRHSSALELEHC